MRNGIDLSIQHIGNALSALPFLDSAITRSAVTLLPCGCRYNDMTVSRVFLLLVAIMYSCLDSLLDAPRSQYNYAFGELSKYTMNTPA